MTHDFWGNHLWEEERSTHKSFRPIPTVLWRYCVSFLWKCVCRLIAWFQGGVYPFGFRFACCIGHVVATFLLLRVSRYVNGEYMSIWGGMLFACHPIHCENLAYIVGFADCLSTIFMACAILCLKRRFVCLGLCLLSSLSKESGFVCFPLCFLLNAMSGNRGLLFWGLCTILAPLVRFWYVGGSPVNFAYVDVPYIYEPDWWKRGLSYLHVHSVYLRLLFFPWNQSWDYSFNAVPIVESLVDLRMLGPVCAYLLVSALVWWSRRRIGPFVGTCLGIFSFVPSSSLFLAVGTVVGERLLYPVTFGVAIVCSACSPRKWTISFFIACYMYLFNARLTVWSSKFSLYETDALAWPRSCKTLHQYGAVAAGVHSGEHVLRILNESLSIFDDNALTDYLISQILLEKKEWKNAIQIHNKIANGHGIGFTDFSRFMFLVDAGFALIAQECDKYVFNAISADLLVYAARIVEEGLEIFPYVAYAHNALGVAYAHIGDLNLAKSHLDFALSLNVSNSLVWNNLAVVYTRMNLTEIAHECAERSNLGVSHVWTAGDAQESAKLAAGNLGKLELFYDRMT